MNTRAIVTSRLIRNTNGGIYETRRASRARTHTRHGLPERPPGYTTESHGTLPSRRVCRGGRWGTAAAEGCRHAGRHRCQLGATYY